MSGNLTRSGYIDTWRFVAVSIVIFGHLFQVRKSVAPLDAALGVYIFFFISGFVVSKASLFELVSRGTFSRAGFYTRRAFRIIPPLMIYLVVCYALGQIGAIDFTAKNAIPAATYLCNVILLDCGWYAGHTWSLAFEEQFYLLFPLIFIWVETSRRPSIGLLVGAVIVASLPFFFGLPWVGRRGFILIYGLFAMGYLFAKYERRCLDIPYSGLLFALGFVLTFLPIDLLDNLLISKYYKFTYFFSIPLMIVTSGSPSFSLNKVLENRITRYIGRISYSIYLWQQLVTDFFKDYSPIMNFIALILMVLGCMLLFTYVETPLIKQGRRLSDFLQSRRLKTSSVAVV